jgi:hypothetical protein
MDKKLSALAANPRPIRVSLPAEVAYDFEKFSKVQKDILGRLGCLACCSGWDIRWDIFRDFRVDDRLNITQGFGG